jgi:hypothetical protein
LLPTQAELGWGTLDFRWDGYEIGGAVCTAREAAVLLAARFGSAWRHHDAWRSNREKQEDHDHQECTHMLALFPGKFCSGIEEECTRGALLTITRWVRAITAKVAAYFGISYLGAIKGSGRVT